LNKSIFSVNTLSKYSNLFQIIGVIGLIASLIFVGLELRQSHKIALSAQQQARVDNFLNLINNQSTANFPTMVFLNEEIEKMTPFEIKHHNYVHQLWHIYEADFLRYRLGLMDENIWQSRLQAIKGVYSRNPDQQCEISKVVWDIRRNVMDKEFVKLVESLAPRQC